MLGTQIVSWLCLLLVACSHAWVSCPAATTNPRSPQRLCMIPEAATSLIAGSIAGAVGVGTAFPLDTIKTKQQVEMEDRSRIEYFVSPSGEVSVTRARDQSNLFTTIGEILQTQGIRGFYGGVSTSMLGQALIKATAFSVNAAVLQHTADHNLIIAAGTAGFVTAFLSSPVDRVKVLMQTGCFPSEVACVQSILKHEGIQGLMATGLLPTIVREIPSYTLYFYLYESLMASNLLAGDFGAIAPAIAGALAGAACVVPVHPVDVVKTIVQHTSTEWQTVCQDVYDGQGLAGFWEGLVPRMSRAAVNHAATFAIYDVLMNQLHTI